MLRAYITDQNENFRIPDPSETEREQRRMGLEQNTQSRVKNMAKCKQKKLFRYINVLKMD